MFRGYAVCCLVVLGGYIALNFFYIRKLPTPDEAADPKQFVEEGLHLAPCGVPMGMNRNLSSSKLQDLENGKTYQ